MAHTDSPEKPAPAKRPSRRKRRKSSSSSSASYLKRAQELLRKKMAARVIVGAVAVFAALLFYVVWTDYDQKVNTYLDLSLADDQHSVLYADGYPAAVRLDGQSPWIKTGLSAHGVVTGAATPVVAGRPLFDYGQWAYALPQNAEGQFTFEPGSGRIVGIACLQLQALPGSCPPMLGVSVGDGEDVLTTKAGDPQRWRMSGMSKLLFYDKMGVQYSLAQRRVYRIDFTARNGGVGTYWAFFFRKLIF